MGEDVFGIITDFTNDTLNELIRQCVDEYALIPWQDTSCGYGCSDHASWYDGTCCTTVVLVALGRHAADSNRRTEYGYRSAFPFETPFYDMCVTRGPAVLCVALIDTHELVVAMVRGTHM